MKKVIRLTEKDLGLLVKRVLKEEMEDKDISNLNAGLTIKDTEILFGMATAYCVNGGEYLGRFCTNLDRIRNQIEGVYSQNDLKRNKFEIFKY